MHFTQEDDGFKGWLVLVDRNGALITGAVAGDFTVTVVDPTDSATSNPSVSESTQLPGLYTFLVPSAFLTANGTGNYGVVVEVNKATPTKITDAQSAILRAYDADLGNVLGATADGSLTVSDALKYALAAHAGEFDDATVAGGREFTFKDRAGADLFTLLIADAGGRTRTSG